MSHFYSNLCYDADVERIADEASQKQLIACLQEAGSEFDQVKCLSGVVDLLSQDR